jgi:hypothetical protein
LQTIGAWDSAPRERGVQQLQRSRFDCSKCLIEWDFWLGGRDSNPDNVVQSHVSYR